MAIRFVTATPNQLISLKYHDLLTSIRISEGRVLQVCARVRCCPLVDSVSNAELAAAFGADIVDLDTYEPSNPFISGFPSKNPDDDKATQDVQVKMGRGYSLKEIREIIGRPVGTTLMINENMNHESIVKVYGNILANQKNIEKMVESGTDFLSITGWASREVVEKTLNLTRKITENKVILRYGQAHGSGILGDSNGPFNPRDLITKDEILMAIDQGIDIITLPAPGTYPGFTVDYVSELIDVIHNHGALASCGVHTSQEGSDIETLRFIALNAKMAGADLQSLGDAGFSESMIEPQLIMGVSIAIKGRRHTYRRMALSIKR